jgi:hypothetical protein
MCGMDHKCAFAVVGMVLLLASAQRTVAQRHCFAQKVLNPTHGSGWIGSGPFYTPVPEAAANPTHGSGWILQLLRPKDLKHPPTAVGGIPIALWVFI